MKYRPPQQGHSAETAATITRLKDRIKRLKEALTWYEYTVSNCYCHGSEGDAARDALRKDQGRKAKEAKL